MAVFHAREDALMSVIAHIEARCTEFGLPYDSIHRLVLVAEELFLNAIRHGGAGEAEHASVQVELNCTGVEVELLFADAGIAYDPFDRVSDTTLLRVLAERREGGLGVVLVQGLAVRHEYRREQGRNLIRLWLAV